jgi:signal transduction histidine kinase
MAGQRSEYEQRLAILEADRSKAENGLQASLSDLQIQLAQRVKELQSVQDRMAMVDAQRQQWEASASALDADSIKERKAFEARLSEERSRVSELDLALKAQESEYSDLQDALAASRKEGVALAARVEEQQKKMQAELALREAATGDQKQHYEQRIAALEKDTRERLQTAAVDATARMNALQARAIELDRQSSEKQAALDRLHQSLSDMDAKRAHAEEQWASEAKERRALQDAAAEANAQFAARLDAAQAERTAAEQTLHAQLLELRDTLNTRAAAIQALERQLKETEQARSALEHYSSASHSELTQSQAALAQQFHAEQERAKMLDARVSAQIAELKQMRQGLQDAHAEREQLLGQVAAEREKAALALKAQEKASTDTALEQRQKAEALERDFRERLASVNAETASRLNALQARATELEKLLATQRADHEQRLATLQAERIMAEKTLQTKISEVQGQLISSEAELEGTRQQLAALEKDSAATQKSTEEQKRALVQRLNALQEQARGLQYQVTEKQTQLDRLQEALAQMDGKRAYAEEQWAQETQERRAIQAAAAREKDELSKRMAAALEERKAAEEILQRRLSELRDALSVRAADLQNLEQRLLEADQARAALQQSAAVSQADMFRQKQELEQRLSEERGRIRELDLALKANAALIKDLKDALTAEQKQYKASSERNATYEQRMDDLRARTADLERQGVEKQFALEHLRETLAELEAKRAQAERQRDDLAGRLSAVQAERKVAEDTLHQRLLELREQLEHRVNEEQDRARGLDTELAGHVADLKILRTALADEKAERERLSKALAVEREKALLELKGREKVSAETTSTLWQQMQAQEKEFRAQLASIEEESGRRIAILQTRTVELEKSLAAQRSDFEQRLSGLQQERGSAEEKLHAKIFSLEESLSRRIAEAQTLHAEFAAVETARSVAAESSSAAHGELVRQQALFDERLSQEQSQARALEQQLQQYKSQAREWKETLTAAKEERRALEAAWTAEKQKIQDDLRAQGLGLNDAREQHERQMAILNQEWTGRLDTVSEESADRLKALQTRVSEMDRQLTQRGVEAGELKENVAALEEERVHLQAAVAREDEAKQAAIDRSGVLEDRLAETQRTHLQAEQKIHARLVELEDQLSRKSSTLNQMEDRLELLQNANTEFEKSGSRDNAAWNRQREDLEKKLMVERGRLRDFEADQAAQKTSLRELQEALSAAEKDRQTIAEALKAQKERFLADLALRDAGSSQRQRALELEREAIEKQWQERLKAASQDTVERMEALRRRAEELEKQLSGRNSELHELRDQVGTLEQDRRELQEKTELLGRERKEQTDAAAAERARLVERSRALDDRLKEQSHALNVQMETFERERSKIESTLEHRLAQLQEQVVKRTSDLKDAEERLHLVEESRAELEKSAGQGHSQWSRDRAQLEERLAAERSRAKDLARQLAEATTQAKDVKESLSDAEHDRRTQMQALAAQKEKSQADLRALQVAATEREKALKARIEELEDEATSPAKSAQVSANAQMDRVRERTRVLEGTLAERDAELHALRAQAEKIDADWTRRVDDLERRQTAEVEKRVSEKLREQMMGALEAGTLKTGDTTAVQTLLEEWVFGFAHQVRNPLGIIRSVAESLFEAEGRRSQKDSLSAIVKAVDGLNLRLKEFIEFSKPVKPLMQSVDLPSAVAAAVHLVEDKGLPAGTTIQTALPVQGTRVWMDPDHLRTILVHLLRNAVEAMPKGGRIQVSVTYEPKYERLELRVQDEGPGIPREHMKEVGRPFFSTKPNAVGLGLALIKRLLRAYDGKLDIESKSGHATLMICRMKTKQESAGQWAA